MRYFVLFILFLFVSCKSHQNPYYYDYEYALTTNYYNDTVYHYASSEYKSVIQIRIRDGKLREIKSADSFMGKYMNRQFFQLDCNGRLMNICTDILANDTSSYIPSRKMPDNCSRNSAIHKYKVKYTKLNFTDSLQINKTVVYAMQLTDKNVHEFDLQKIFAVKDSFYIPDNGCISEKTSPYNGIIYFIDDSCRLTNFVKYKNGNIVNMGKLHNGRLDALLYNFNDTDTLYENPINNTEQHFTRQFSKLTLHKNGRWHTFYDCYTTKGANPEKDYTIFGDVYFFDEQGEYIESVNHVQLQKRIWNNNHSSPPAETAPHKVQ